MNDVRAKFEYTCKANSVICEYLYKCRYVGEGQYVLIDPVPHNQYMADRLTGAYWAFQEQEKANLRARGSLKVEIAHLKIEREKLMHRISKIEAMADRVFLEGL